MLSAGFWLFVSLDNKKRTKFSNEMKKRTMWVAIALVIATTMTVGCSSTNNEIVSEPDTDPVVNPV